MKVPQVAFLIGITLSISTGSGCEAGVEPGLETVTQEAYPDSNAIWSSAWIPVCWEDAAGVKELEKGWIRDAVEGSWEEASSVDFYGWEPCSEGEGGLRVKIKEGLAHTKGLGRHLDGVEEGVVIPIYFEDENGVPGWCNDMPEDFYTERQNCIRFVSIHEFGHALGFSHEHNRLDTPGGCDQAPQGPNGDFYFGDWDPNSVMNYCKPNWDPILSEIDRLAVQVFYGPLTVSGAMLVNDASQKCLDVSNYSTANAANVHSWECNGTANQRWHLVPVEGGQVLVSENSMKCLDVAGFGSAEGTNIHQWHCNAFDNQIFDLTARSDGAFELRARNSGMCVDVAHGSSDNGANVLQWWCNGAANQAWRWRW